MTEETPTPSLSPSPSPDASPSPGSRTSPSPGSSPAADLKNPAGIAAAREAAIDRALEASIGANIPIRPPQEAPLKKQWDKELEDQLEAALKGFDPRAFDPPMGGPARTETTPKPGPRAGKPVPGASLKPNSARRSDRESVETMSGKKTGKVISIRGKSMFIDLGTKSEGVIPLDQFEDQIPKPGETIDVVVDRFDEDEGILLLVRWGATVQARWETLRPGQVVEARAIKVNKGGLDVDVDGIRGFLPIGQIDLNRVEDAATYLNQRFPVVVTEANERQENLVVSRREWLERKRAEERIKTWAELAEGQTRQGIVRSIKEQWAFVDLGGVDGFLHVAEASWARVNHIGDLLKTGQEVQVKVLKIDREAQKVTLGLKQLTPSPWDRAEETYHKGKYVQGKVTKLMDFGAFVELEPGIEGLIHVSELSPNRVRRVADIVKTGQEVEVRVLGIDSETRKISLSLKPLPGLVKPAEAEEADEPDAPPAPPKPAPKIPLKGGGGKAGGNPFAQLSLKPKDPSSPASPESN